MGIGYIFGCLISILFWRLDKQNAFLFLHKACSKLFKSRILLQLFYIIMLICIGVFLSRVNRTEMFNVVTAFLVIDIGNTERKNLRLKSGIKFYNSISTISRSIVCGFAAPILYILIFGNAAAILYMLIYNISISYEELSVFNIVFAILSIIPAIFVQIFLYSIYIFRNKKLLIDFNGDYLPNCLWRPLLNVDIMAAYIENVNFYYYHTIKNQNYVKCYGKYHNSVDDRCIRDYLSVAYIICLMFFTIFILVKYMMRV